MLRTACRVALVEPGDVFLFSGAQAHATLCVGDGLCLGAYESFISLAPAHAQVFLNTNDPSLHFKECHAEDVDLDDIRLDLADQLIITMDEQLERLDKNDPSAAQRLRAAVDVFRSHPVLEKEIPAPPPAPQPAGVGSEGTSGGGKMGTQDDGKGGLLLSGGGGCCGGGRDTV